MLSSKELMEKTGVSRATLNNYIGLGLIPKPVVKHPDSADSKARRLGYFPASAVSKVDKIRRLKRDGMRMPEIVEKLTSDGAPAAAPTPAIEMAPVLAPVQAQSAVPIVAQDNSPTVNEPRDPSPSDLPGRDPRLAELSVLATELEHADKIRAELPPEEYFELINRILADLEPLSRQFGATFSKWAGSGLICYFVPQPDHNLVDQTVHCALEMRAVMAGISQEWRVRKNWPNELKLNFGLDAGRQWIGAFTNGSYSEFSVLGETERRAALLAHFGRDGAVWVSKDMLVSLNQHDRAKIAYGIRRLNDGGDEMIAISTYALISGEFNDLVATEILNQSGSAS